ncbi:MAG: hypothetical protein H5U40_16575 [Polyangiaceae bacterium]|nr:hypothetical protein [Polyangiaceae bacterium]
MSEAVISLPHDLKAMLRVVEDAEVSDDLRVAAAGAVLHVLSAGNAIPGVRGVLQRVGDALLLRLVLDRLRRDDSESFERHREDSPELLDPLEEQLEAARGYLGDRLAVLERFADGFPKLTVQGHSANECVADPESMNWLYGAVLEAIVDRFEFDEDDVARELKSIDRILPHLENRIVR